MRVFRLQTVALLEFEAAADWYESEREGLGLEFASTVHRTLARISQQDAFATAPIARGENYIVRREFVERFPYIVVFVETDKERRVIMIARGTSDPARWRSRV